MPKSKRPTNRQKKKSRPLHEEIEVVGPDCFQLLRGELFGKPIALLLCGESHFDAIDVTRSGGRFSPREGWVELPQDRPFPSEPFHAGWACRIVKEAKKLSPLAKAQDWGKEQLESEDMFPGIVLAWIEMDGGRKGSRGKAYLLQLCPEEALEEEAAHYREEEERDDLVRTKNHWLHSGSGNDQLERYPAEIRGWILGGEKEGRPIKLFEWGDLDAEAFAINKRRLTEEVVSVAELDALVNKRKQDRKRQNIWTFDDWFAYVRSNSAGTAVHLMAEASVPPWEVELHRPPNTPEWTELSVLPTAADCIRCVSEDSEASSADEHDPSSDGIGSYLDHMYRRFMAEMMEEERAAQEMTSTWFHCIDLRDLGAEEACHADGLHDMWKDLLTPVEWKMAVGNESTGDPAPDPPAESVMVFRTSAQLNTEQKVFQEKKEKGELEPAPIEPELKDDSNLKFSYPSFESFFGQNTDFLYYSPHIHVSYSPFLSNTVKSLKNWEDFFTKLFFTGTVNESLSCLDLQNQKEHLYIRSPILKEWDSGSSSYIWKERKEPSEFMFPFLPYAFHLKAKSSEPARTWSAQLHHNLYASGNPEQRAFAESVAIWTRNRIEKISEDPKGNDDSESGGDWFLQYLRAVHREVYDDIDHSDPAELLKRNHVASETTGGKHAIGKIKMPSCEAAFEEIVKRLEVATNAQGPPLIDSGAEVLAKILIDIWVQQLVDHSSVLKIGNIIAKEPCNDGGGVLIVAYMGLAHTRVVADYFCNHAKFVKKGFYGKVTWGDDESRRVQLPSKLWNLGELF